MAVARPVPPVMPELLLAKTLAPVSLPWKSAPVLVSGTPSLPGVAVKASADTHTHLVTLLLSFNSR